MKYMNITGQNVSQFHSVIVQAMENGGKFSDDFSDIFVLKKAPEGSAVDYILDFA